MLLNRLNFLFLLCVFLMPIDVWAETSLPTKDIEVSVESSVTVSSQRIVLGDVATIYAKSMHDFKDLSGLVISQIPEDQSEIRLPQSYLQNRIKEVLPPGTEFVLHAKSEIVFKLQRMGITPVDFAAEIERMAKAGAKVPQGVETEIEVISGADQLKLFKPENLRIEAAAEMPQWKGELAFKAVSKENSDQINWVKVKVRWFANVWVAKKTLGISQTFDAAAFTQERREITSLREEIFVAESLEDLQAKLTSARARRSIGTNTVLTASMVERKPDAGPGQALKVIFVSESGIRVSTDGALIGASSIGSEARAKLKTSRKIVTGKLVSGGVMEVSL
ncbi:MAG: flagella basal body P-ring formation protein FlgA [Bdellovibrionota bacterium]